MPPAANRHRARPVHQAVPLPERVHAGRAGPSAVRRVHDRPPRPARPPRDPGGDRSRAGPPEMRALARDRDGQPAAQPSREPAPRRQRRRARERRAAMAARRRAHLRPRRADGGARRAGGAVRHDEAGGGRAELRAANGRRRFRPAGDGVRRGRGRLEDRAHGPPVAAAGGHASAADHAREGAPEVCGVAAVRRAACARQADHC
mmetsp:Transcript_30962/g.52950  ORF Transcript_30962/g.52950 Transcript_30962/m.52950 type:complete len:204 (-) Transcript_30962:679-1290(-)